MFYYKINKFCSVPFRTKKINITKENSYFSKKQIDRANNAVRRLKFKYFIDSFVKDVIETAVFNTKIHILNQKNRSVNKNYKSTIIKSNNIIMFKLPILPKVGHEK